VEGKPAVGLYYVAVIAGAGESRYWIGAVQLEEGDATFFSTGNALGAQVMMRR